MKGNATQGGGVAFAFANISWWRRELLARPWLLAKVLIIPAPDLMRADGSAYVNGERLLGHNDPGAEAVALLLEHL